MNSKKKEELEEQYEDAVLALLMNDYAEQAGNQLLQEYEEALVNNDIGEIPLELDAKCKKMIQQAYSRSRTKDSVITFFKSASRVAVIALVLLGICTTLILSVEALRVPVLNFIISQDGKYASVGNTDDSIIFDSNHATIDNSMNPSKSPIIELLPEGFEIRTFYTFDDGSYFYFCQGPNGQTLTISADQSDGLINTDTEDSYCKSVTIGQHEGVFIENSSKLKVMWFDSESSILYQIRTANMDIDDFWAYVELFTHMERRG